MCEECEKRLRGLIEGVNCKVLLVNWENPQCKIILSSEQLEQYPRLNIWDIYWMKRKQITKRIIKKLRDIKVACSVESLVNGNGLNLGSSY